MATSNCGFRGQPHTHATDVQTSDLPHLTIQNPRLLSQLRLPFPYALFRRRAIKDSVDRFHGHWGLRVGERCDVTRCDPRVTAGAQRPLRQATPSWAHLDGPTQVLLPSNNKITLISEQGRRHTAWLCLTQSEPDSDLSTARHISVSVPPSRGPVRWNECVTQELPIPPLVSIQATPAPRKSTIGLRSESYGHQAQR